MSALFVLTLCVLGYVASATLTIPVADDVPWPLPRKHGKKLYSVYDNTYRKQLQQYPWDLKDPHTTHWIYGYFGVDDNCSILSADPDFDFVNPLFENTECQSSGILNKGMFNAFKCMNHLRGKHGVTPFELIISMGNFFSADVLDCSKDQNSIAQMLNSLRDFVSSNAVSGVEFYFPLLNVMGVSHVGQLFKKFKQRGDLKNIELTIQVQNIDSLTSMQPIFEDADFVRARFFELQYDPNLAGAQSPLILEPNEIPDDSIVGFGKKLENLVGDPAKLIGTFAAHGLLRKGVQAPGLEKQPAAGWGQGINLELREGSEPYCNLFDPKYASFGPPMMDVNTKSVFMYNDLTQELLSYEGQLSLFVKSYYVAYKMGYRGIALDQPVDDSHGQLLNSIVRALSMIVYSPPEPVFSLLDHEIDLYTLINNQDVWELPGDGGSNTDDTNSPPSNSSD